MYSLHLLVPNSQCIPFPHLLSFSLLFIIFPYHYIETFLKKFFLNWPFGLWELNSPAKDEACTLGSESQSPNYWTTGEFPSLFIYFYVKVLDAFLLSFTDRKKKRVFLIVLPCTMCVIIVYIFKSDSVTRCAWLWFYFKIFKIYFYFLAVPCGGIPGTWDGTCGTSCSGSLKS